MTDKEWKPKPWAIDPEHGRVRGPGFLGDAYHSLRVRELFRYYQPPTEEQLRHVAPINTGNEFVRQTGLISSTDPILAAFANLTTRVMNMRRCIVSMTGAGTSYIIAESTRTLSLSYPHTYEPGDALMFGGGVATSSLGGLCEHTCSLLPPPPESDEPFLLEIPDLSQHPKFCNVGYVRDWPHARFYCGAPLRTKNGVTIGTVCVMDEHARYDGLTEKERMIMSNMADLFMQYLETKQGDRFRKRNQMMEMELSHFIAEGFLPNDGEFIPERRNGKLWSESILENRRRKEKERRKKVAEKRQVLQEMEYAKMVMEEQEGSVSHAERFDCDPTAAGSDDGRSFMTARSSQEYQGKLVSTVCDLSGMDARTKRLSSHSSSSVSLSSRPEESQPDRGIYRQDPPAEEYVPIVHPLQPGIIEMVPVHLAQDRITLLEAVGTSLPGGPSAPNGEPRMIESFGEPLGSFQFGKDALISREPDTIPTSEAQYENATWQLGESVAESNATSSISGTIGSNSESFPSVTVDTSMDSRTSGRRRSKYEETTSMEPHFRAMYARASTVIKNTIDCDVVFVDGDLEGFFEPELAEADPHASDDWGWSHISSDEKVESTFRAKRPKKHRQRSGVLGYATSKGASTARFDGPKDITDLGFDMSELNEELLQFLLKGSKTGKIFSFFDEYPGLEEHEGPEEIRCKKILQKFLPGCRSVIVVPLHDHNNQLSAVCFAWTCSDRKTFYGDEEGRFVTGVATSVMDEIARMHILSADKAKSEFISSISHELRSPLHGILASAEFLLDSPLSQDQRAFVETIISCGTTLLDTVNQVLDFQKLNVFSDEKIRINEDADRDLQTIHEEQSNNLQISSSGNSDDSNISLFNLNAVGTDFSAIVQEVTEGVVLGYDYKNSTSSVLHIRDGDKSTKPAVLPFTKTSKLEVVLDIDNRDEGWTFYSNPAIIKRIVGNLVSNSIKYTQEKGWVKVALLANSITPASNGAPRAVVSLIVSDSGKGMSREFLKTRLFTPFTQENPMAAGSGLGLSIVRQLVRMLDGQIDVSSQLGKGTTITITMKVTQKVSGTAMGANPRNDLILQRSKTAGKRGLILGFERFKEYSSPEQRGANFLYESFIKYAKDFFKMEVVDDSSVSDASDSHIIVVNEFDTVCKLQGLAALKTRPVIVMSSSTPRYSDLKKFEFDRDPRYFTYLRKPCGPKKLAMALQFCIDILEHGLPPIQYGDAQSPPTSMPEAVAFPPILSQFNSIVEDSAEFTASAVAPLISPQLSPRSQDQQKELGEQHPQQHAELQLDRRVSSEPSKIEIASALKCDLSLPPKASTAVRESTAEAPVKKDITPRQPNILCVEDNKINMMLLTTYLKNKKYPFKMAYDGAEAIERFNEEVPAGGFDCILMDLQMPILSGIESTREIRALESKFPNDHKRTFIIALTGLAAGSDRREAFNAGVDAFMVKPVSFKDLEKILDEHVRKGIKLANVRTPEADAKRESIVSVESSRGKHIEIKQLVSPEKTDTFVTVESVEGSTDNTTSDAS